MNHHPCPCCEGTTVGYRWKRSGSGYYRLMTVTTHHHYPAAVTR